ncbi:MAG: metallophosphoesterase [Christensenellales bacterium]
MRIFAISDLHLSINNPKPMDIFGPVWSNYLEEIENDWREKVTDDDVVLMAGDFSWAMKLADAKTDIDYISKLPGKKIIIRGNHDYWWEGIGKVRAVLPPNFYAIQNDSLKIDNVVFCGTRGWTLDDEKLVNRELIRLEMTLKDAKSKMQDGDRLVCMLHYPPFDKFGNETAFSKLIESYPVTAVVYGHLHGYVSSNIKNITTHNGVDYYLTSCDQLKNKLAEIKL